MSKFCRYCGTEMRDGSEFCPACGRASTSHGASPYSREPKPPTPTPAPVYNTYNVVPDTNDQIASVGRWFWFLLLFSVPIVGQIFLIITACGGFGNKSMTNYARANLIYLLIAVAIIVLYAALTGYFFFYST